MSNPNMTYSLLRVHKLRNETDKAICVLDTNDVDTWLPKSQIEITKTTKEIRIRVPEWLAKKYPDIEFEEE